jgi:hypothetical protein
MNICFSNYKVDLNTMIVLTGTSRFEGYTAQSPN